MVEAQDIQNLIQAGMPEADVHVLDPLNDGAHLQAIVISTEFEGKPRVLRHKMVYATLGDAFVKDLHALSLATKTPAEWQKQQETF